MSLPKDWRAFVESRPPERTCLFDANQSVYSYLMRKELPATHAGPRDSSGQLVRALVTFDDLAAGKLGRQYQEEFLRSYAPARFIKLDTARAADAWRTFLKNRGEAAGTPLEDRVPLEGAVQGLWSLFVQQDWPEWFSSSLIGCWRWMAIAGRWA